jgi:hypothetical protein
MGGAINLKHYVEYAGRRIYVCCPPCTEKIEADPKTYADKVAETHAKAAE